MADLLLRAVRIRDRAVDVRIRDGRVDAVAAGLPVDGAEVVDCDGRTLVRGLWDEHVHVVQAALAATWLPLGGAASAAEVLKLVRAAAPATDGLLVGIGFRDGVWPDEPDVVALDAVSACRQVVLQSHDLHAAWLNSAAAARFGAPVDGSGLVREAPAFRVAAQVNALALERADTAVRALGERAAALGVVGVGDFEMTWSVDPWRERIAAGFDLLRVEAQVYPQDLDRAIDAGLRTGEPVDGGAGLLTTGHLKVLADGALNTRTAYLDQPYPDGTRGLLTVAPDDLERLLRRAASAGLLPAVHAIGDAAISAALDVFSRVGTRGRVEHAQLVADRDLPRFAALGVTASVQPAHLLDDRDVAERHWPGRTHRAYPFRALLDAGATLAFGSDAPVAPLDPWLAIRAAVDRGPDGDGPWHGEQRITPDEALAASTRGRAEPRVGDVADLALIEEPVERMHAGAVAATLLGGRFTHRRV